ncbi:N-6 DNA methylase [Enterobacter cloacae complex sp. 339J8]|uniref:N-6 DNA methylase n=1 Tax=Enterobacter cloacae complex sp. 339J8 TaxID=3395869 RepID=UPI003CE818B9
MHGQTHVNKIYDPAAGSGLICCCRRKNILITTSSKKAFSGQEINHTTLNLVRTNMFLHNINYDKFDIRLGNTLTSLTLAMKNRLTRSSTDRTQLSGLAAMTLH